jgi:hypothetical protein
MRSQNVADEPAEERDARAERGRGVSFDGSGDTGMRWGLLVRRRR